EAVPPRERSHASQATACRARSARRERCHTPSLHCREGGGRIAHKLGTVTEGRHGTGHPRKLHLSRLGRVRVGLQPVMGLDKWDLRAQGSTARGGQRLSKMQVTARRAVADLVDLGLFLPLVLIISVEFSHDTTLLVSVATYSIYQVGGAALLQ